MANRKSYNAVLKALRREGGLNQAEARVAWRGIRDRLGESPRVKDLRAHPRITQQEVRKAPAAERAIRADREAAEGRKAGFRAGKGQSTGGGPGGGAAPRMVIPPEIYDEILEEWDAFEWDDEEDYG